MSATPQAGASQLSLGHAVRRHLFLVLASTVVFAAALGALALQRAPSYAASASVVLRPLEGTDLTPDIMGTSQQIVGITTEASLVNSAPVVQRVNGILGTNLQAGTKQVTATVPANTQVVQVQYKASTPQQAQRGAQAFANSLLSFRSQESATSQKLQQAFLERKISADLAKAAVATGVAKQALSSELAQLRAAVGKLQSGETNSGFLSQPAQRPTSPSGLSPLLLIIVGALLGLGVGLALALWRDRMNSRASDDDIATGAGVLVLANLRLAGGSGSGTVATSPPDSLVARMFQEVRARLLAVAPPSRAVTVMANDDASWASFVGVNLAESLASAGYSVVLVSAAEDSRVEQILAVDPAPGLADVLLGEDLDQVTRTVNALTVVPRGAQTHRWSDLLAGRLYSETVDELKKSADYVVVVGGRAGAADALPVTLPTDGVVLTASHGEITAASVDDARRRVGALGVPLLGLVVVEGPKRRTWRRNPRGPAPAPHHQHVRMTPASVRDLAPSGERESALADQRR